MNNIHGKGTNTQSTLSPSSIITRYVLGLSQGTVSELLSKPKSWDKLTEKGRDSYRKMHAWVWDDQVTVTMMIRILMMMVVMMLVIMVMMRR